MLFHVLSQVEKKGVCFVLLFLCVKLRKPCGASQIFSFVVQIFFIIIYFFLFMYEKNAFTRIFFFGFERNEK